MIMKKFSFTFKLLLSLLLVAELCSAYVPEKRCKMSCMNKCASLSATIPAIKVSFPFDVIEKSVNDTLDCFKACGCEEDSST